MTGWRVLMKAPLAYVPAESERQSCASRPPSQSYLRPLSGTMLDLTHYGCNQFPERHNSMRTPLPLWPVLLTLAVLIYI